jgi:hypothetical protein
MSILGAVSSLTGALPSFTIPGSVLSAVDQARGSAGAAALASVPSYSQMLSTIQSGAINVDHTASLNALSGLGINTSAISSAIATAQSNMAIDMAVSKAALAQAYKTAQANGTVPTAAELAAATAPLSVLKNTQSLLSNATSSLSGVTDPTAIASVGSSLSGSFAGAVSAAASAKASILSTLKADAFLATLTKPMAPDLASIANSNLNLNSIDKYAAIKAQEAPQKALSSTPPDPIRASGVGTASILKDVSPSVAATVPATKIWSYELSGLKKDTDAAREAYWSTFGTYGTSDKASDSDRKTAFATWFDGLLSSQVGPDAPSIRAQSVAIKKAQPDKTLWTAEELAITQKSAANAEIVKASQAYITVNGTGGLGDKMAQYAGWYKTAYAAWLSDGSRFDLPADLLTQLSTYKI